MRYEVLVTGRLRTLKEYRRSMSLHKELPPRNMARSSRMIEIKEKVSVIDSSVTCRMERELIDGIKRKKRAPIAIPRNARSLNIPLIVMKISGSIPWQNPFRLFSVWH
jgi:hypothetical protein